MKSLSRILFVAINLMVVLSLVACGATPAPAANAPAAPAAKTLKTYKTLVVGFAQIGAESGWRDGETQSIKETAAKLGVDLKFSDAQQKQENQISAMRSCIQQGVNVIALPPVVETGWDAVLQEAKDANIPVIVVDRSVTADPSMYASHIGSDMVIEGKRAAAEFNKMLVKGAHWAVGNGYGNQDDLDRIEATGCLEGADPDKADHAAGYSARDYAQRDPRARDILRMIESKKPKSTTAAK